MRLGVPKHTGVASKVPEATRLILHAHIQLEPTVRSAVLTGVRWLLLANAGSWVVFSAVCCPEAADAATLCRGRVQGCTFATLEA